MYRGTILTEIIFHAKSKTENSDIIHASEPYIIVNMRRMINELDIKRIKIPDTVYDTILKSVNELEQSSDDGTDYFWASRDIVEQTVDHKLFKQPVAGDETRLTGLFGGISYVTSDKYGIHIFRNYPDKGMQYEGDLIESIAILKSKWDDFKAKLYIVVSTCPRLTMHVVDILDKSTTFSYEHINKAHIGMDKSFYDYKGIQYIEWQTKGSLFKTTEANAGDTDNYKKGGDIFNELYDCDTYDHKINGCNTNSHKANNHDTRRKINICNINNRNITNRDMNNCNMNNRNITNRNITNRDMNNCDMNNCDMNNCDMNNCATYNCNINNCSMNKCVMNNHKMNDHEPSEHKPNDHKMIGCGINAGNIKTDIRKIYDNKRVSTKTDIQK